MNDRIDELEQQAKVILEWCRQQRLPEEQRDILEFRKRQVGSSQDWMMTVSANPTNLNLYDWRLRKRPRTHKATVYWYRFANGTVSPRLSQTELGTALFIGTSTVEFTEPQE